MAARTIDGKAVAAAVRERVRDEVAAYVDETGRVPTLATVIVGDDPASEIYVRN
ncbi:MAG: bifunctional methylenetetrahydrofolate dehydrogenase/methenyltetrahydrofolate cyclohydrolase FolD, partial [Solirubrobacterales bacterium]|nr:bifunctional methylenetetrahydrofolate dehydrogenase/methenyltetrahydrofolate cyclohydrolase FolD [Solirubrobacterales bacterium]